MNCTALKSLSLPDSLRYIDFSAFEICPGITSVFIPDSVSYIAEKAFRNCSGLTTISFPRSLSVFCDDALEGCKSIRSIYIYNEVPPKLSYFSRFFDYTNTRATLYVPKGSYDLYKTAEVWKNFSNIQEMDDTMSGVNNITDNNLDSTYFTIDGKHNVNPQKGLNIIKNSNGSTKKVIVR